MTRGVRTGGFACPVVVERALPPETKHGDVCDPLFDRLFVL